MGSAGSTSKGSVEPPRQCPSSTTCAGQGQSYRSNSENTCGSLEISYTLSSCTSASTPRTSPHPNSFRGRPRASLRKICCSENGRPRMQRDSSTPACLTRLGEELSGRDTRSSDDCSPDHSDTNLAHMSLQSSWGSFANNDCTGFAVCALAEFGRILFPCRFSLDVNHY